MSSSRMTPSSFSKETNAARLLEEAVDYEYYEVGYKYLWSDDMYENFDAYKNGISCENFDEEGTTTRVCSICVSKEDSAADETNNDNDEKDQDEQLVVCTRYANTVDTNGFDSAHSVCSATYVPSSDEGAGPIMNSFCFTVTTDTRREARTRRCQHVSFSTVDDEGNSSSEAVYNCDACDSTTGLYDLVNAGGGNLADYGITLRGVSGEDLVSYNAEWTSPTNWLAWSDPLNDLTAIPDQCPLQPGHVYLFNHHHAHQYKIWNVVFVATVLCGLLGLLAVRVFRKRFWKPRQSPAAMSALLDEGFETTQPSDRKETTRPSDGKEAFNLDVVLC